jgi:hypothetical protein
MRALAAGWIGTLACAAAIAAPPTGIEALTAYAGEWKADITHLDTPFSKAGHETYTLRNDCWLSGTFYACHQYVDGDSKAVIVFAFDAKSNSFSSYPITPGADAVHAGKLLIDGNTWTFPWQTTDNGKTIWFRVVNVFGGADTIGFRQEYSADQVHWIAMASGHEQRIARGAAASGR